MTKNQYYNLDRCFFFLLDLVVPKFAFKGGGQLGIPFGKGFLEHGRRLLAVKINSELK